MNINTLFFGNASPQRVCIKVLKMLHFEDISHNLGTFFFPRILKCHCSQNEYTSNSRVLNVITQIETYKHHQVYIDFISFFFPDYIHCTKTLPKKSMTFSTYKESVLIRFIFKCDIKKQQSFLVA